MVWWDERHTGRKVKYRGMVCVWCASWGAMPLARYAGSKRHAAVLAKNGIVPLAECRAAPDIFHYAAMRCMLPSPTMTSLNPTNTVHVPQSQPQRPESESSSDNLVPQ